jgi:hypothetical protein
MVTLMVTNCSVDQSHIYQSDLWSFIAETPECCPSYLSVGIRLFQDSPGRFRGLRLSAQRLFGDDDGVSVSSVYFGTFELDLWLHVPSDGCDRFRNQGCDSEQQMIRWLGGWHSALHSYIILILHSSASNSRLAIWGVLLIENLVERHFEFQNVDVKILSVSMKSESKDRSFLIWIDVAFMHINLFAVLQVSGSNVLVCFRNHCSCS